MNQEKVKDLVKTLLTEIGEDPTREGLKSTPVRVAKAYEFLTSGYQQDIDEVLNGAIFNEKYDEMVLVKNIDFYSMCEHHLLPFYGLFNGTDNRFCGLYARKLLDEQFVGALFFDARTDLDLAESFVVFAHIHDPAGPEVGHYINLYRGLLLFLDNLNLGFQQLDKVMW